jgi:hypothetical protein
MRHRKNVCAATLVGALAIGIGACGGSGGDAVVMRVGSHAITKATVDHWASVVRRGGAFTAFRGEPVEGTPRTRAVALLITSEWLIGEAEREGLPISEQAIQDALAERTRGEAGAEFRKRLLATGQTVAGFELELRAELALEAVRRELERRSRITPAQVAAFYQSNRSAFAEVPEARVVDIIERLPSAPAATALVKRIGSGKRFTRLAYHKRIVLSSGVLNGPASKKAVDYAIFAARPGVVSRPMRLSNGWAVFVVRKIVPARGQSFAKAHDAVAASLEEERKREVEDAFKREFRSGWTARTSCAVGYVAPGCVQYHGRLGAHEDPFFEG